MQKLKHLIIKNRSYRRFHEDLKISMDDLHDWIDNARLSSSAKNMQPLRYILCSDENVNAKIFDCLMWAAYLKDWDGPVPGERPSAYIVMLADKEITDNYFCDDGIAAQSILLGAVEKGYGGCIIASVSRERLRNYLQIDDKYKIIQVIALGKPKEEVVLDELPENGDIKYWRDSNLVHHVPKRALEELIVRVL